MKFGVHVDDLATQLSGDARHIVGTMKEIAIFIDKSFRKLKLKVSPKTCVVASKPQAARRLCSLMESRGIPSTCALATRDRGIDAAAGMRRRVAIMRQRIVKGGRRLLRLKVIKRYNKKAKNLYRTNIWPSSTFGPRVTTGNAKR